MCFSWCLSTCPKLKKYTSIDYRKLYLQSSTGWNVHNIYTTKHNCNGGRINQCTWFLDPNLLLDSVAETSGLCEHSPERAAFGKCHPTVLTEEGNTKAMGKTFGSRGKLPIHHVPAQYTHGVLFQFWTSR